MNQTYSRRQFVKTSAQNALGIGIAGKIPLLGEAYLTELPETGKVKNAGPDPGFVPLHIASWWCTLEDILWPQKQVVDKIKRRAEAFSKSSIDTAINFGFHIRFDFSNYFGQLHGYYANVCEELHKYDIKFMDHYSCNHVERPRGEDEFRKVHKGQRHHVLLFHDPVAADYAQYEGHFFKDICEVDLRDGTRGYARQYQMEVFCHNNPDFLEMHGKYLKRLLNEVPLDGMQVDDMCDYAGLTTCGCSHCRSRFKKEYGHEIPPFGDSSFWGDTAKNMLLWGNYENPVFRDWIRMKMDSVADHVKMVKGLIGEKPLMTCCSSTGPITLNSVALNLERMAPYLDYFMLENVGLNINCADWVKMDAEALQQKDIAQKRGNAPAMALSYTVYRDGGYLGWCLSRFWGVANWSSTLNQRMEEDPVDAMEIEEIIGPINNWELKNSDLNYVDGEDLAEVRLVSNSLCRDNGWRDPEGLEHWDRIKDWSECLVKNNIGYRFVRSVELSDTEALAKEKTPLILDGLGCVSDAQFTAIKNFLSNGGKVWLCLPFGTHDERGFARSVYLSAELLNSGYRNLIMKGTENTSDFFDRLIKKDVFRPVLRQLTGDPRWAARIRNYRGKPVIHFLNTALDAVPHPTLKDIPGIPILKDLKSKIEDNNLGYEINSSSIVFSDQVILSPELGDEKRNIEVRPAGRGHSIIHVNLEGVNIYAVVR